MKVSELFKVLDWDLITTVTNKTDTKSNVVFCIMYINKETSQRSKYTMSVELQSSPSNCGLIYIDYIINLLNGWMSYLIPKKYYGNYLKLKLEEKHDLQVILIKYLLRNMWVKQNYGNKNLIFTHCKHNFQGNVVEYLPIFQGLVSTSYISPKNKNSSNIQIHGCIDINDYESDSVVPQYLVDAFKDAG